MKPGEFINAVSELYRVDEMTVVQHVRLLKREGLLTKGARGNNAPDMTPMDAARITIALLATDKPAHTVETVRKFSELSVNANFYPAEGPEFGNDKKCNAVLEDILKEYFEFQSDRMINFEAIEINRAEMQATMIFESGRVMFDGSLEQHLSIYKAGGNGGLQTIGRLNASALQSLAIGINRHKMFGEDMSQT